LLSDNIQIDKSAQETPYSITSGHELTGKELRINW